ncbi:hypothetical protein JCM8097_007862 [Rhodosporidiobolus ruineniae]
MRLSLLALAGSGALVSASRHNVQLDRRAHKAAADAVALEARSADLEERTLGLLPDLLDPILGGVNCLVNSILFHADCKTKAPSGFQCDGSGHDGYSYNPDGSKPPSAYPSNWLWWGSEKGWGPPAGWECADNWSVPDAWRSNAHLFTWWTPPSGWLSLHWSVNFGWQLPSHWGIPNCGCSWGCSGSQPTTTTTTSRMATSSKPTTTTTTSAAATTTPAFVDSGNLALSGTATASSQDPVSPAAAAIDGQTGGYLDDGSGDDGEEWSSWHEGAGAWIKISWNKQQTFNQIGLFDRPNLLDQVTSGYVLFEDGTGASFGALDNAGEVYWINLMSTVKSSFVKVVITSVKDTTQNVGLSEVQVYLADTAEFGADYLYPSYIDTSAPITTTTSAAPTSTAIVDSGNLALTATATASSEDPASPASGVNDGFVGGYTDDNTGVESQEWSTYHGYEGSWVQLSWTKAQTFNQIALFDRLNSLDQVTSGYVIFDNGKGASFGQLDNAGAVYWLNFMEPITSKTIKVVVTGVSASTQNTGFSEIEVYLADTAEFGADYVYASAVDTSVPQPTTSKAVTTTSTSTTTQAPSTTTTTTTTSAKPSSTPSLPNPDWQCNGSGNDGWTHDHNGNACPSQYGNGQWLWFGTNIGWAPSKSWSCGSSWVPALPELTTCSKVNWWLPPQDFLLPISAKCPITWTLNGWLDHRKPSSSFQCDKSGEDGFDFDHNGNKRPSWTANGWRWYGKSYGWQPCKGWKLPSSTWRPSLTWDARPAVWWSPDKQWQLFGLFKCPSFWPSNLLLGSFLFW